MDISEPLLDFGCNLPELLAGDLEKSGDVFSSRHLTAGAPAPGLADDRSRRCFSMQTSMPPTFSSQHRDTLIRAKSLQALDQIFAQPFLDGGDGPRRSISSVSSSECSDEMRPRSSHHGDGSVITAPTSINSDTHPLPTSHKKPKLAERRPGDSWMDLDMEDAVMMPSASERRHSMVDIESSRQQLTRRKHLEELRSMSLNSRVDRLSAFYATSQGRGGTESQRSPLVSPSHVPARRSSLRHQEYPVPAQFLFARSSSASRNDASTPKPAPPAHRISQPARGQEELKVPADIAPARPSLSSEIGSQHRQLRLSRASMVTALHAPEVERTMSPDSTTPPADCPIQTRSFSRGAHDEAEDSDRPISPAPPSEMVKDVGELRRDFPMLTPDPEDEQLASDLSTVDAWLETSYNSMFPHGLQSRGDGLIAPLPLPPNVLEMLRLAVTCFPDTVLTCSSVSIETIRSHSRRLRYRADPPRSHSRDPAFRDDRQARPSMWRWISGGSKGSSSSSGNNNNNRSQSDPQPGREKPEPLATASGALLGGSPAAVRPAWAALKNIFPGASDYLCDALYAHVLAYNYITALCPRAALMPPSSSLLAPQEADERARTTTDPLRRTTTSNNRAAAAPDPYDIDAAEEGAEDRVPGQRCGSASRQSCRKAASFLGMPAPGDDPPLPRPPASAGGGGSRTASLVANSLRSTRRSLFPAAVVGGGAGNRFAARAAPLRPRTSGGGAPRGYYSSSSPPSSFSAPSSTVGAVDPGDLQLRGLRLGLARCIARLVSTVRQGEAFAGRVGSGGGAGAGAAADKNKTPPARVECDPLFMRALCEVVRCSEEQ
ncbi:hypothetical protein GGR56DRAFT_476411 [Xylariaceae sp. FL0804]|nr:hypothetical protein GGR56DRAFT_476411 [Xylariaceae sp. FL0804]